MPERLQRKTIDGLKGIHDGKLAFVWGSGPSLRLVDQEILRPYVNIAVNASFLKAPFADYYFTCDSRAIYRRSFSTVKQSSRVRAVFYERVLDPKPLAPTVLLAGAGLDMAYLHQTRILSVVAPERVFSFHRHEDREEFANHGAECLLIKGTSSMHVAVNFAQVLGCSPIVLLGCDCCSVDGKTYFSDFPDQPREDWDALPEGLKFQDGLSDGMLDRFRSTWAGIAAKNPGVAIINASGGALDCFPRLSIKEVLATYGHLKR